MIESCHERFLQTLIFNVQLRVRKDRNSKEIFVMGSEHSIASVSKISLLLWYICTSGWTLKIDVCKKLHDQVEFNVQCASLS